MTEMLRARKEPNERKQLMESAKLNHKLDCKNYVKLKGKTYLKNHLIKHFETFNILKASSL